jgi:hypothetical protein
MGDFVIVSYGKPILLACARGHIDPSVTAVEPWCGLIPDIFTPGFGEVTHYYVCAFKSTLALLRPSRYDQRNIQLIHCVERKVVTGVP